MANWNLLLQRLDERGTIVQCDQYTDVPIIDPAEIAITGETSRLADIVDLFDVLTQRVAPIVYKSPVPASCGGPSGTANGCRARQVARCKSVLVVLLSHQRVSQTLADLMSDWLTARPSENIVIPVLPDGADPTVVLPASLKRLVVLRQGRTIDAIAPDVLCQAGIGGDAFRMFISYRWTDSEALATQLFETFSKAGFDVFVDRFRGAPGRTFPPQLGEFLMDKGLVLVLESPEVRKSNWTWAEVIFSSLFRLGLMSVHMPSGTPFGYVSPVHRFDARNPSDWSDGRGDDSKSTLIDPDAVVRFVRQRYALQLARRRVFLESKLDVALLPHGLHAKRNSNGTHRVSNGSREYILGLSSRPANLDDVRRVSEATNSSTDQKVAVGPAGFLRRNELANLRWLLNQMKIAEQSEFEMRGLAQSISNNRSLP